MCYTPTDVLMVFIESILDDLVYQINLYRTQNNKILRIQREDMLVFIGTNFFMGYHNIPSYKNYWSTSPDLGVKLISNAMPRNTFEKILVNLHCNDNKSLPPNNKEKLFKLTLIIEKLNVLF
uniref:PiggyBac transposable element-derived protein 3 n=1 Tax=Sipha flava TaxID=143950 RepID=A0A2S2QWY0_9HEMI